MADKELKVLVGIPCMETVHANFAQSLVGLAVPNGTLYDFAIGSLIYDARNHIVYDAINQEADLILWLDSDMVFSQDLFVKLVNAMNLTKADIVTGLYFTRKTPITPVIYSRLETEREGDMIRICKDTYMDYPKDQLFPIHACGFGACLTTVDICKKVIAQHPSPFAPLPGMGEDMSFCYNAREAGGRIYCDSRIKLGHIGNWMFSEAEYQMEEKANG